MKSKVFFFSLLLTTYCLLSFNCCGYSTRSLLPGHMRKLNVKLFENATVKTGLDELATQAVTEAFRTGSGLKLTDEKQADLVIECRVANYVKEPYVYTGALNITQYKVTVTFSARCVDQVNNTVFWEGEVADWTLFTSDENQGIAEAMKKTAQKLVTTILTNW
jgi:hypothetical protein